jgi:hypothetical protein
MSSFDYRIVSNQIVTNSNNIINKFVQKIWQELNGKFNDFINDELFSNFIQACVKDVYKGHFGAITKSVICEQIKLFRDSINNKECNNDFDGCTTDVRNLMVGKDKECMDELQDKLEGKLIHDFGVSIDNITQLVITDISIIILKQIIDKQIASKIVTHIIEKYELM